MTDGISRAAERPVGRAGAGTPAVAWLARIGRWVAVAGLSVALGGCAIAVPRSAQQCPPGHGAPTLVVQLFFGQSIPALGQVTEADWNKFVNKVVVPNLPNGFTVFNASGAWMSPTGHTTIREPTKVLLVSLPDAQGALAPVKRIRNAYQLMFRQERVGMNVAQACGDF